MSGPFARIVRFGSADGLSESYVSHGIQDSYGYIWFCTRDGLVQYDGYRFKTYKSRPGDDCPLKSNRMDFVEELPDHNLRCHSADNYYVFHRDTRRFELLPDTSESHFHGIPDVDHWVRRVQQIPEYKDVKLKVRLIDNQEGIWIRSFRGLERVEFRRAPIKNIKLCPERGDEYVSCLFVDSHGRLWVGDKNHYLYVFDKGSATPRYLAPDGRITGRKTAFGHVAYTVFEDSRQRIWIGTKPDGLFCLVPSAGGYEMRHYENDPHDPYSISSSNVYSICEDARRRIWIGTYGGGLNLLHDPAGGRPAFINKNNLLRQYPRYSMDRIRCMAVVRGGILLIGTTDGLVTTRLDSSPADMRFFVNRREQSDRTSLGNNNVMGIQQDTAGNIFVATNGGGVSRILSANLLSNDIRFKTFTTGEGMASDACLNLFLGSSNRIWAVGELSLMQMDMVTGLFTNHMKGLFCNDFLFTEAKPVCLPDGNMVFATNQGILKFSLDEIKKSVFVPKIRFTCPDTLVVGPDGKSFSIEFAALDYSKSEDILYMYKMEGLDDKWLYTKDNSIRFSALPPGTYRFVIRSTNGEGVWVDNEESIMIYRKAAFNETYWAWMLYGGLLLFVLFCVYKTCVYIRSFKREMNDYKLAADEKLEYMANRIKELMSAGSGDIPAAAVGEVRQNAPDEMFAVRAREYVEQNFSNSDIDVNSFAVSMNVSRSLLYLKCKSILGVSPNNYILDYRIRQAKKMLARSGAVISEVAFACGFSDPKYFSRCFKKATGQNPSEYSISVTRQPEEP